MFLWATAVTLIKASILMLYRNIFFCHRKFIWLVDIVLGFTILFWIAYMLGALLMCQPVAYAIDKTIKGGHCGLKLKPAFYLSASLNLTLDIILVILPAPLIWRLKLPVLKKIGTIAMFALGIA